MAKRKRKKEETKGVISVLRGTSSGVETNEFANEEISITPAKYREEISPLEADQKISELFGFFRRLSNSGLDPVWMEINDLEQVSETFDLEVDVIKKRLKQYLGTEEDDEEPQKVEEPQKSEEIQEEVQEEVLAHQDEAHNQEQVNESIHHQEQAESIHDETHNQEQANESINQDETHSQEQVAEPSNQEQVQDIEVTYRSYETDQMAFGELLPIPQDPNAKVRKYMDEYERVSEPKQEQGSPKRVPRKPKISPNTHAQMKNWLSGSFLKTYEEKLEEMKKLFTVPVNVIMYYITNHKYADPAPTQKRYVFNDAEHASLLENFNENAFPSWKEMSIMAFERNIPYLSINNWFKNRRVAATVKSFARHTFSSEEEKGLAKFFEADAYPDPIELETLSQQLGIPVDKIDGWFKRKRVSVKRLGGKIENPKLRTVSIGRGRPRSGGQSQEIHEDSVLNQQEEKELLISTITDQPKESNETVLPVNAKEVDNFSDGENDVNPKKSKKELEPNLIHDYEEEVEMNSGEQPLTKVKSPKKASPKTPSSAGKRGRGRPKKSPALENFLSSLPPSPAKQSPKPKKEATAPSS